MITDEELKVQGVRALVAALGEVQAQRFVSLLTRAPLDYTEWRTTLWPDIEVEQLSLDAMRLLRDVHRGLADVEAGRVVPHDEALARLLARYE